MRRHHRLSLHGTAVSRFAAHGLTPPPGDRLSRFFERIADGARVHDLDDDSLTLAEELVRLQAMLDDDDREALALAVLASMVSVGHGSSRLPLTGGVDGYLGRIISSILRAARLEPRTAEMLERINAVTTILTFDRIIGGPGEYRPLLAADGCLYQQRMLQCERNLADRLRPRIAGLATSPIPATAELDGGEMIGGMSLSAEQLAAVDHAVDQPLTIISGGPGTGKTAVIVAILRRLIERGVAAAAIALAGPTGKAANRMALAVQTGLAGDPESAALIGDLPPPQTIHRLLGYLPHSERFRHHENNPLDAAAVIIDEASMVDLDLMERLLRAVSFRRDPPDGGLPIDDSRLILIGDADQLPSVAAGAVLRDLVAALPEMTVRLTRSYRVDPADPAGSHILAVADRVNRGATPLPLSPPETGGVSFVNTHSNLGRVHQFVDDWSQRHLFGDPEFVRRKNQVYRFDQGELLAADRADLEALFLHYERSRILTITRRYPTGSEAVNARVHNQLLYDSSLTGHPDFYPGEPILMRRNDYHRGLFNGDNGLVVRVSEDGGPHHFRAVFPQQESFRPFHIDPLRAHIELAFAITVHKSQGSEFDHVAVLLPTADLPLLTREMLYTAITRARRSVVLVAGEALLSIATNRTIERFSGVAEKLGLR